MRNSMNTLAATVALLLCLRALTAEPSVYCDNIVVVLDASGSMDAPFTGAAQTKMEAAKAALKQVLTQAPQSAQIGLLVFSAKNLREDWAYPLGPRDDEKLS